MTTPWVSTNIWRVRPQGDKTALDRCALVDGAKGSCLDVTTTVNPDQPLSRWIHWDLSTGPDRWGARLCAPAQRL